MSEKALRFVQFNETYLNGMQKEKVKELTPEDVTCYKCGQPFKRGEWFVRKFHNNGHGKKRHIMCAVKVNLITEKQAKKYLTCLGMAAVAAWVMVVTQMHFLIS